LQDYRDRRALRLGSGRSIFLRNAHPPRADAEEEPGGSISEECAMEAFRDDAIIPATASGARTTPQTVLPPVLPQKEFEWLGPERTPQIVQWRFAEAEVAEMAFPPVRVRQGTARTSCDYQHLVCLLEGCGHYQSEAGKFTQTRGDVVLLSSDEACEVVSPERTRIVRWSLPRSVLAPMLPNPKIGTTLLSGSAGLNRVLCRHARDIAHEVDAIPIEAQRGLLTHLCGLVGLALETRSQDSAQPRLNQRTQVRQRVLIYIDAHLLDPNLTARRAAEDLGISPRWLHSVLEDASLCFSDLVARKRVQQSLKPLEDADPHAMTIAEIAFQSGFDDLSTFYRRFRRYMHMTPGEWREQSR
jgi:AraC family transcriptional regulator, positive regulator of tynA and feaB